MIYKKQMFPDGDTGTGYDSGAYCNFNASSAQALAGANVLLCVWDTTGTNLLAVAGQQNLTINRSADSIEVNSKDTEGNWKSKIAGMKEWSIDSDGFYVTSDDSHRALTEAFQDGDPVCVKIVNKKTSKGMFGGLGYITDYTLEAPYDDAMTYSITIDGNGALTDLTTNTPATDTMPK